MTEKEKKIRAFKELIRLAKAPTFDLHTRIYEGGKNWPERWYSALEKAPFKSKRKQQEALDKTLEKLTRGDLPSSRKQMEREKNLIRLVLDAGANPNTLAHFCNVFYLFSKRGKFYGALEVAKTKGFSPRLLEESFKFLTKSIYSDEDTLQLNTKKELLHLLFEQENFPQDKKMFEKLVPVVLEQEPDFFERKKKEKINQLSKARTPIQFLNAIAGKQKVR